MSKFLVITELVVSIWTRRTHDRLVESPAGMQELFRPNQSLPESHFASRTRASPVFNNPPATPFSVAQGGAVIAWVNGILCVVTVRGLMPGGPVTVYSLPEVEDV